MMSTRLPAHGPGQVSCAQFQRDGPPSQQAAVFSQLNESIPKTEDQWQEARKSYGLVTDKHVYSLFSALVHNSQDAPVREDLRRLVDIAVCCVKSSKDQDEAYREYRSRGHAKEDLGDFTIRNYISLVRGLVGLLDELYESLRHRAFEAVLLYAPLKLGALGLYKKARGQFKSCFSSGPIPSEIQASLPLYLPSIVAIGHPQYQYQEVCQALETNIIREDEHVKFVSVFENGRPIPYLLPDPTAPACSAVSAGNRGRYDPVRDDWFAVTNAGATDYQPLAIREPIQQILASTGRQEQISVPKAAPGATVLKLKWSPTRQKGVE